MKRRRKNFGFTLIELIIGVMMTAIIMSAMGLVIGTAMKGYELSNDATEQTNLMRNTLERLSREIRAADGVAWSNNMLVINPGTSQTTYAETNGQLVYTRSGTSVNLLGPSDGITVTDLGARIGSDPKTLKTTFVKVTITYTDIDGRTVSVNVSACPRKNLIN